MADPGAVMAVAAALILLGVLASKLSDRLGVPALLVFLVIGMLAGSEGVGGIAFDDFELARAVGVVARAFILFAGGLETEWRSDRPVLREGARLATVGGSRQRGGDWAGRELGAWGVADCGSAAGVDRLVD